MAQDTRKDPRARVLQMTVRYKSATVDEFIEHHSHDVSRGGIFIKTPSPFPAGTLLKFEIRLLDEQAVIAGVGRVVWKREPAQGSDAHPSGMGVKFIKIDEKSKAVITRLVDAQQGAGSAFEAGITDLGDEAPEPAAATATTTAPAPAPQAEPAAAKAAQVKRASTMLGLGSIGATSKGDAGKSDAMKKADPAEAGSFFPQTNPEKEMPPPDERTMMKQAAELLKQALAEAGGSLDEVGASKEPLIATPPKKAEPAPVPKQERAKPLAEPAALPVVAVAQLANERETRDDLPAAEARAAKVSAAKKPAEEADRTPAEELHGKPARQEEKAADEPARAKPVAAKPKDDKAVAAKAAATGKTPLAQEEESSGTGRLLTILLVAAALCGALWLVFGQSDPKPTAPAPATPAPEQPAAKPEAPEEKPRPTEVVPAATDTTAPTAPAAPAAAPEVTAAPTPAVEAPTKATAEPAAPTATAEPAAPTATAEPAAPTTATAEPAAPKPTATPAPRPAPRPRPAAPKPPKNDDPYG